MRNISAKIISQYLFNRFRKRQTKTRNKSKFYNLAYFIGLKIRFLELLIKENFIISSKTPLKIIIKFCTILGYTRN
ncbi:hypothetical protein LEP1GSC062_0235 [Leptospira alexanderi serovar Manhao 3 str. L 60]|uniref:Uncharacterized protein n=1 Tax=Leptospira alexanderi serovar Manhao 3 str. L 60 TaxID=1049759 RepID=V6HSJ9_9LEPT|nr:hypothetical protein LEP1GSC062_0235 [Leptospira alexanderi serovar Manhao 3 str. L 60]